MSLPEIFDSAVESMEVVTLRKLIIALCEKGLEYGITGSDEEGRFLKIISLLLGVADHRSRAFAAENIAEMQGLPNELYMYFACDEIAIAKDFLKEEIPLTEDDMIHLIDHATAEHLITLVEREDLSPTVVQKVLRSNNVAAIRVMNQKEATSIFFEYDDSLKGEGDDQWNLDDMGGNDSNKENPIDVMIKMYADKSRFADVIELLAKSGSLPKETVKGLFSQKDAEPISILCRGLGMSQDAFASLAKFRAKRLGQLERLAETAIDEYLDIETEYAEAMLVELQENAVRMAINSAAL